MLYKSDALIRFGDQVPSGDETHNRILRSQRREIKRSRNILLPVNRPKAMYGELIEFELFNGELMLGIVNKIFNRGAEGITWSGSLQSLDENNDNKSAEDRFSLSCYLDACTANLVMESTNSYYMIQPATESTILSSGQGIYDLVELKSMPSSGSSLHTDITLPNLSSESHSSSHGSQSHSVASEDYWDQFDGDLIIDIGVMYTPESLTVLGNSPAVMMSKIHLANDEGNLILERSQVSLRTRIVFIKPTDDPHFQEPGDHKADLVQLLQWLFEKNDGKLDEAHRYRDEYMADVVVLINECPTYSGIAYINTYFNEMYAFGAYNVRYLNGDNWSHELGHIQGCYHDRFSGDKFWQADYNGYGNCWEDATRSDCTCYRSVMVYVCDTEPNHCTDCRLRSYYANQNVMNAGSPTGTELASCGSLLDSNRRNPISFRNSIYNAGIITSVTPSFVLAEMCVNVTIKGWMIGYDSEIIEVSLDGVRAVILESSEHHVVVQSSRGSEISKRAGDVIVKTSSGRVSESKAVFSYTPSRTTHVTDWSRGLLNTVWRDTGGTGWTTSIEEGRWAVSKKQTESTNEVVELSSSALLYSLSSARDSASCGDTLLSMNFSYWAYSPTPSCYEQFSVSVMTHTDSWTEVWIGSTEEKGEDNPWIPVTLTLPQETREVRFQLTQAYSSEDKCEAATPLSLADISLDVMSVCGAQSTCLPPPDNTDNNNNDNKDNNNGKKKKKQKKKKGKNKKKNRKKKNKKRRNKRKNKNKKKTAVPTLNTD
eukprot:CAMPEP_0182426690 /NCGR_PEP_ID=MMETSP1167-20130531/13206_1 /TAXON_ID=2988 /ORGANISM="Mallomonas Sp, Strain CCMP3275" /LENGTH=767 /DNA_ID=CAMNT_0024608325 /DNA_START=297 /DNA_END=2600 /DNA_ORIENTATION=-